MTRHEVARTLVKSAPELWEVCSDVDSLSRHLEAFGEIRITRVEPESTVAWEGERASGTVRIEPSGWGTRVILTATPVGAPEPGQEPGGRLDDEAVTPGPGVLAEPVVSEPAPADLEAADLEAADLEAADLEAAEPEADGPEASEPEPDGREAAPIRRGFLRRLGGLLFRSLVTPVEISDAAFAVSPPAEPEVAASEFEARPAEPEPVEPAPQPAVAPEPAEPAPGAHVDAGEVLQTMLSRLGSDHHRPFSRS